VNILIIAPQWIGDCVMAQPLMACLRAQHPQAQIAALALPHIAPVLRAMPEVDAVIDAAFTHGKLQWGLRRVLARTLKAQAFDVAYVLPNSIKSALVPWLAGIATRVGYHGEGRYGLLNQRLPNPLKGERPLMTQFYAALAGTDATPLPTSFTEPTLVCSSASLQAAQALHRMTQPYIVLAPGAEYGPAKQWPAQHFRAAAELAVVQGFEVLVLGGPKDQTIGSNIAQGLAGVHNLCGSTTLDDAIALLAGAKGAISNDSGLMHVAAALKVPTVGLYGSTSPHHTPPAAHRSATIWLRTECSPCYARTCRFGHTRCLHDITPQMAWSKLSALMTEI
jgi:heptosyltransferase-2